jgi:predicted nucleic acid-binding protein
MGWVDRLRGKVIGLDTAPLIYYIEENPAFLPLVDPFFDAMIRGDFEVVTSTMTITEVLVHPIKHGDTALMTMFRDILHNARHLHIVPFTADIAEIAARLRADHNIRTPDAIQMATAVATKADFFLTNDTALPVLPRPGVLVLENMRDDQ